ncbi:MAG: hypothetical protein ACQER9_03190 [Nanobdellota archaeon]
MARNDYSEPVNMITPSRSQNATEYTEISKSIRTNVNGITENQRTIDLKEKIETTPYLTAISPLIYSFMSITGRDFPEWSELFNRQLSNVKGLSRDLAMLIYSSSEHLKQLENHLYEDYYSAQGNIKKLSNFENKIPCATSELKNKSALVNKSVNQTKKFEEELQAYESESKLTEMLNEVALMKAKTQNDRQNIDFLKKHIAFHRRMIFASKRLAVTTNQMCSTLENLTGIYETLQPLGECLDGIYEGVQDLRNYAGNIQDLYIDTFKKIDRMDLNSPDTNILSQSSDKLDDLIARMTEDLKRNLEND